MFYIVLPIMLKYAESFSCGRKSGASASVKKILTPSASHYSIFVNIFCGILERIFSDFLAYVSIEDKILSETGTKMLS